MNVSEAVASRRSVRGFLSQPVDLALIADILGRAMRAPSGGNLQPWHIHVVSGRRLDDLKALMAGRLRDEPGGEGTQYDIYPRALDAPYSDRRFAIGEALYGEIGIAREDTAARRAWFARNYQCFGAPVALFCYLDRKHGPPQWADCGMYLQTVMLLLREAGLDSCPQECWAVYPRTIDSFLGVPGEQILFTGMSIGIADPNEPANRLHAPRADAAEVIHYHLETPNAAAGL